MLNALILNTMLKNIFLKKEFNILHRKEKSSEFSSKTTNTHTYLNQQTFIKYLYVLGSGLGDMDGR